MAKLKTSLIAGFAALCLVFQHYCLPQFINDQRSVTYQIGFRLWENKRSKTYKGTECDRVSGRCDTRFVADVELIYGNHSLNGHQSPFQYTWPGPHPESEWMVVGKKQYETTTLHDFAAFDIANLQRDSAQRALKEAILRVHILDVDVMKNDNINWFICRLPGMEDLSVASIEERAEFGRLIDCHSTLLVIPGFRDNFDRDAVKEMRLRVAVRAWYTEPLSMRPEASLGITQNEPYTFGRRQLVEEQQRERERERNAVALGVPINGGAGESAYRDAGLGNAEYSNAATDNAGKLYREHLSVLLTSVPPAIVLLFWSKLFSFC